MIRTFLEAEKFVFSRIDADPKKRFAGAFGLRRGKHLLELLGNPQNDIKIVHVAGTSGKGSTSFYISKLLQSLGFKTGLTISPHLVDIRERCQINGKNISKREFVKVLNRVVFAAEEMTKTGYGPPSYFEIMIAVFFLHCRDEKVDYAVVETGLGGMYDGTNVVDREDKLCVITRIGLDHTEILGDTLEKIATQKAGIIHKKNQLVTINQEGDVDSVIKSAVDENEGQEIILKKNVNFGNFSLEKGKIVFDFKLDNFVFEKLVLDTNAYYQIENASLALAAVIYLGGRDRFDVNVEVIRRIFASNHFKGRMETISLKGKKLILDGAHNPQKMACFLASLEKIGPEKFVFLIAFRKGKDFRKMLSQILPLAKKIILTSFTTSDMDLAHRSEPIPKIEDYLEKENFTEYLVVENNRKAFERLLRQKSKYLVVTGSLYLLSSIYPYLKN